MLWSLALAALNAAGILQAPFTAQPLVSQALIDRIDARRSALGIPGVSIAVVASPEATKDGWKTQLIPLGIADAAGNPMTEDSLFAIASNSKVFTALSVAKLIEDGTPLPGSHKNVTWATKAADILPGWKLPDSYASSHVDLTDLASMRSGMPSHDLSYGTESEVHLIHNMRHLKPSAEIRQIFQYNNQHYSSLAQVVAELTGKPYIDYVQKHFFDPLGMTGTTYDALAAKKTGKRTDGYIHAGINGTACDELRNLTDPVCVGTVKPMGWWTPTDAIFEAGPGAVVSNGRDMAKWMAELLSPGKAVSPSSLAHVAKPIMVMGDPAPAPGLTPPTYGMGQMQTHLHGQTVVYHTGRVPGHTSLVARLPDAGLGVVVLTNDGLRGGQFYYDAADMILSDLLGVPSTPPAEHHDAPIPRSRRGPRKHAKDISGHYFNAGYGPLHVRPLSHSAEDKLVSTFLREYYGLDTSRAHVTTTDKLFINRIAFTHFDGPFWNVTVIGLSYPSTVSVSDAEMVIAEGAGGNCVVTDKGIGMFEGFSTPGRLAVLHPPSLKNIEERAEAWFKRVKK